MNYNNFAGWQLNKGASPESIKKLRAFCNRLPFDYLMFLESYEGGEGYIGDNYLVLWKTTELIDFNSINEVDQYAPGILLIGTDGAGEGYGFDLEQESPPVVKIPLIGMSREYATLVSLNFSSFFNVLETVTNL